MPSDEARAVLEMLRGSPVLLGDTIHEMRANMEAATASAPTLDDVSSTPVDAGGVGAEWVRAAGCADDRVIVYLHGGGYCIGSIATHRALMGRLSRATGASVLGVDYRLAPEHPYPAAVEDGTAAYQYVCDQGCDPAQVAIAGDSAGGGLTVATLVALRETGRPLPAAGVCISPWTDLSLAAASIASKAAEDPIVAGDSLGMMADAYLGGTDARHPGPSPLFADLAGLPPLLIQVGSAEILLDDATGLADRARTAGVESELEVWDDMIHVWHAFAQLMPEGQEAIDRIAAWLAPRFGTQGA